MENNEAHTKPDDSIILTPGGATLPHTNIEKHAVLSETDESVEYFSFQVLNFYFVVLEKGGSHTAVIYCGLSFCRVCHTKEKCKRQNSINSNQHVPNRKIIIFSYRGDEVKLKLQVTPRREGKLLGKSK